MSRFLKIWLAILGLWAFALFVWAGVLVSIAGRDKC